MLTAEEAIQFHVILVAVDDNAVGLVMTEHQFAHVRAMSEAAVEHPRQHAALAAVVAIVPFHARHVHLRTRDRIELGAIFENHVGTITSHGRVKLLTKAARLR